jgi:gamma-glutamylputrescine oxidase
MTEPKTWYAGTAVPAPERPALSHDLDADVCVIGAGLAGLTVAREVARRGWSVAVLEAGEVAGGASGRNAGFVSPGFAERVDAIVERVGLPRAKELWALSVSGVDYIRRTISQTQMPGVEPREGRLSVRRTDDEPRLLEHAAMLRVDFGADVEAWPTDQVREVLRSPYYFQAIHFAQVLQIHPLNYALGLAADAEKYGARIFQNTRATGIDPAGVRKRVQTTGGMVRARHVVLAGSTGIGPVDEQIAATVLPISTCIAVTAPLGEKLFDAVRYSGAVADTRRASDYYRVVEDDRLLWGGRVSTRTTEPRRLKAQIRRDILAVYPQLGEFDIEHAWSGTMAYAVHKMPQIGELAPGYWLASAFGGHGLNTTAMAGEMIARAILDGDDRWRLFSSYELVWAGGTFGRAAAATSLWMMQKRDAVAERISRYRDQARRESQARQARWEAEKAARRAEAEARRAEEEAGRVAEKEARRLAAEEARQAAAEKARLAREEVDRIREERRVAAEEAKRGAEAQAMREVAQAASTVERRVEEYKAASAAAGEATEAAPLANDSTPTHEQMDEAATAAGKSKPRKSRKSRSKKKKESAETVPPVG